MNARLVPLMVRCECWAFLTWMTGLVPLMVRCECWACLSDMYVGCVPCMVRCKCWAGHSDLGSDISDEEYLPGGQAYNQHEKGWVCRTSCDEKNHEIAHMMMTRDDLDHAMIQIQ